MNISLGDCLVMKEIHLFDILVDEYMMNGKGVNNLNKMRKVEEGEEERGGGVIVIESPW